MKDELTKIIDGVLDKQGLSDPEMRLEIATAIMKTVEIPQHQSQVGAICDAMTELSVLIAGPSDVDPEKLAPEDLARVADRD